MPKAVRAGWHPGGKAEGPLNSFGHILSIVLFLLDLSYWKKKKVIPCTTEALTQLCVVNRRHQIRANILWL